jgi:hypothetical protein
MRPFNLLIFVTFILASLAFVYAQEGEEKVEDLSVADPPSKKTGDDSPKKADQDPPKKIDYDPPKKVEDYPPKKVDYEPPKKVEDYDKSYVPKAPKAPAYVPPPPPPPPVTTTVAKFVTVTRFFPAAPAPTVVTTVVPRVVPTVEQVTTPTVTETATETVVRETGGAVVINGANGLQVDNQHFIHLCLLSLTSVAIYMIV